MLMNKKCFQTLGKTLSEFYPYEDDARRIADTAGLKSELIAFRGSAITIWSNLLREAKKQRKLSSLKRVTIDEYPKLQKVWDDCNESWFLVVVIVVAVIVISSTMPSVNPNSRNRTIQSETVFSTPRFSILTPTALLTLTEPSAQRILWIPEQNSISGICVETGGSSLQVLDTRRPQCTPPNLLIPWHNVIKDQIEHIVLPQVQEIPADSETVLTTINDISNLAIKINDATGVAVGDLWLGKNPCNDWSVDGLIRVGRGGNPLRIWAIFERQSNDTYRRLSTLAEDTC